MALLATAVHRTVGGGLPTGREIAEELVKAIEHCPGAFVQHVVCAQELTPA
jgi:hypothetical protein